MIAIRIYKESEKNIGKSLTFSFRQNHHNNADYGHDWDYCCDQRLDIGVCAGKRFKPSDSDR